MDNEWYRQTTLCAEKAGPHKQLAIKIRQIATFTQCRWLTCSKTSMRPMPGFIPFLSIRSRAILVYRAVFLSSLCGVLFPISWILLPGHDCCSWSPPVSFLCTATCGTVMTRLLFPSSTVCRVDRAKAGVVVAKYAIYPPFEASTNLLRVSAACP